MIPRLYKLRLEDGDERIVCIDEREHCELLHEYSWSGRSFGTNGRQLGKVTIPVKDWNRLVKDGKITTVNNQ